MDAVTNAQLKREKGLDVFFLADVHTKDLFSGYVLSCLRLLFFFGWLCRVANVNIRLRLVLL